MAVSDRRATTAGCVIVVTQFSIDFAKDAEVISGFRIVNVRKCNCSGNWQVKVHDANCSSLAVAFVLADILAAGVQLKTV